MRETELDILTNSRLAVSNSCYFPMVIGCIIVSTIYGVAKFSCLNILFQWVWLVLAVWILYKSNKSKKHIMELRKNGS